MSTNKPSIGSEVLAHRCERMLAINDKKQHEIRANAKHRLKLKEKDEILAQEIFKN